MFPFITLPVKLHVIDISSIKHNINYAWFLGSHALGKLILPDI